MTQQQRKAHARLPVRALSSRGARSRAGRLSLEALSDCEQRTGQPGHHHMQGTRQGQADFLQAGSDPGADVERSRRRRLHEAARRSAIRIGVLQRTKVRAQGVEIVRHLIGRLGF